MTLLGEDSWKLVPGASGRHLLCLFPLLIALGVLLLKSVLTMNIMCSVLSPGFSQGIILPGGDLGGGGPDTPSKPALLLNFSVLAAFSLQPSN